MTLIWVLDFYPVIITKGLPPSTKGPHNWDLKLFLLDAPLVLKPSSVYTKRCHDTVTAEEKVAVCINDILAEPMVLS